MEILNTINEFNTEQVQEEWRDVVGYEGLYLVSSKGRVISLLTNKELKPSNPRGYRQVVLSKNNITLTHKIHRLVALAFIPNTENKPYVDHIDGTKDNNCVSNLRWVTPKENIIENNITLNRNIQRTKETCCFPENKSKNVSNDLYKGRQAYIDRWKKSKKKVCCVETGHVWNSLRELARVLKVEPCYVSLYCSGRLKCKGTIKFEDGTVIINPHFKIIPKNDNDIKAFSKEAKKVCIKKVRCIETGRIWDSRAVLEAILEVGRNSIARYCRGERTCNKTVTFEDGTIISNPHFEYVTTKDYGGDI